MHFKRRKSKAPVIILFTVVALAVFALVFLLFNANILNSGQKAQPIQLTAPINGLSLSVSEIDAFAMLKTTEEQQLFIDNFISFAKANGFNSVFIKLISNSGEEYSIFGRNRSINTLQNVSANDKLFNKFDPMDYLTAVAIQNNIAVFGTVTEQFITEQEHLDIAQNVYESYSFTGMYYEEQTESEFGMLQPLTENTTALFYTAAGAWANPSSAFSQTLNAGYNGLVVDDYALALEFGKAFATIQSAASQPIAATGLLNYTPPQTLQITFPTQDTPIYTSTRYIMGTCEPNLPLYLNGTEITQTNDGGFFGVLVDIHSGENIFELKQGDLTYTHILTQPTWSGSSGSSSGTSSGSSSTSTTQPQDGTQAVEGEYVIIANWIASVLSDAGNDAAIIDTARQGAQVYVQSSVLTYRSGAPTWAYEITGGGYVLARNTTPAPEQTVRAALNSASAQAMPDINGEKLTFTGSGTPLAFTSLSENTLSLRFFDTDIASDFNISGSAMVQNLQVNDIADGAKELLLYFSEPLHGYSVEYEDGNVVLYLKNTPKLNTENAAKPLIGVSVLLDAGHGDTDSGAIGVGGLDAPSEKHVNLAVTMAAKTRLEQMGATVYLTRSDDVFLELEERNALITHYMPDFFISVHHNSVAETTDANDASGIECYYFTPMSEMLAQSLVTNSVAATSRPDRGAKWGYYYVARNNICPSVLFEAGFMVNPAEYSSIVNEQDIWLMGDAIAQSVLDNVQ